MTIIKITLTESRPSLDWRRDVSPQKNAARLCAYRKRQLIAQRDPATGKPTLWKNRLASRTLDGVMIQEELRAGRSTTAYLMGINTVMRQIGERIARRAGGAS